MLLGPVHFLRLMRHVSRVVVGVEDQDDDDDDDDEFPGLICTTVMTTATSGRVGWTRSSFSAESRWDQCLIYPWKGWQGGNSESDLVLVS